jgi:transcription initiation factor IIE alpha subunit
MRMSYPNLSWIQIAVLKLLSKGKALTRWQIRTETGIRVRSLRDSIRRLKSRQLIATEYDEGNFKYYVTINGLKALDFYKNRRKSRTKHTGSK